jgi:adenylosuccinate lyase
MATIIWCDHVRHIVEESRTDVLGRIEAAQRHAEESFPGGETVSSGMPYPKNFTFFNPVSTERQIALNVTLISSVEAVAGDGV